MITCTNCGFDNEDGARFCGRCREFLQWTGRPAAEEPTEVEPEPEPPAGGGAAPKGVVERVVDKLTGKEEGPGRTSASSTAEERLDGDGSSTAGAAASPQEDPAAALQAEVAARAEREAEEAERKREEAEMLAREQAEATERARQQAEEAERARQAADEQARQEAEAMAQAERELEAARVAREETQEQLRRELEAAEAARKEAEERARAEAEAAEAAARAAAEAEEERRAAEAKAKEEAEAAERARRAAAMVARPKPAAPRRPAPVPTEPVRPGKRRPEAGTATSDPATEPVDGAAQPTASAGTKPGPAPVKPGRSRVRPTTTRGGYGPPTRKPRPGDLICGVCGESNDPTRNFCRRCGSSLAEAEVAVAPWWRRLLPARKPKRYAAGERPGRGAGAKGKGRSALKGARGVRRSVMGRLGKVTRVLMVVGFLLGMLGISFNPGLRGRMMGWGADAFQSVRRIVAPEFERVAAVGAVASSEAAGHPGVDAVNDTDNRWWAEGAEGNGEGERLVIEFAEPVDIAVVGITPGAAEPEQFVAHPRPRLLHLVFSNGATADLRIADEHEFQTFEVQGATGVISVEVQVLEVWQGQSGSDLSITSIEFRSRR